MVITGNNKAQHSKLSKLASPNYQQLQLDASHRGALSREEAERKQRVPFVAAFPILKLSGTDPCTPQAPSHPIPSQPSPASCSPSRTECRCLAGFSRKKVKARIQRRHFSGVWPLSSYHNHQTNMRLSFLTVGILACLIASVAAWSKEGQLIMFTIPCSNNGLWTVFCPIHHERVNN